MTATRVKKKKLTLGEAADQFEHARRERERLKPLEEEAAAILKEHFEKTGRSTYKDRIALSTSSRNLLDQAKVREFLGERLGDFQKRTIVKSLSLLKD